MKLLHFNDFRLGVLRGDEVVDVTAVVEDIPHIGPHDRINGLIERFDAYRVKLEDAAAKGKGIPLASVRIRPPLPQPVNFDCMAVNYMENGTLKEPPPINAFTKSPNAIIGDGDVMVLPDIGAQTFEAEAELAVVFGKRAFNVKAENALDYIFGYINFIDGSARGVTMFYQGKSRETFAPIGPFLVTKDEIEDPQSLSVKLWKNGTLMQDFNTSDMAHKIPRSIEFVTAHHTFVPGDILATGTNHRGLSPVQDGDKLELEVEGLGRLHVSVRDDLKRVWPRETRLERRERGEPVPAPQISGKYAKV